MRRSIYRNEQWLGCHRRRRRLARESGLRLARISVRGGGVEWRRCCEAGLGVTHQLIMSL